jgi:hypothetical protein
MRKNLLDTATGGLCVTITSQVVVYAPAVRAETFSLFPLSSSLLCCGDKILRHEHSSGSTKMFTLIRGALSARARNADKIH